MAITDANTQKSGTDTPTSPDVSKKFKVHYVGPIPYMHGVVVNSFDTEDEANSFVKGKVDLYVNNVPTNTATPTLSSNQFESLVKSYESYLTENGLISPTGNASKTGSGFGMNTTQTNTVSAVDKAIDEDPSVLAARKKAADAVALELKKKAGTITNP